MPRRAPALPRTRRSAPAGTDDPGPPGSSRRRAVAPGRSAECPSPPLDLPVAAAHLRLAPAAASGRRLVGKEQAALLSRAAADSGKPIGERTCRGARDGLERRGRSGRGELETPLTAHTHQLLAAGASSEQLVHCGDRSPRRRALGVQCLGQRGELIAEAADRREFRGSVPGSSFLVVAQRHQPSKSGRRSGGGAMRPCAVLMKSSQTASPRRVN